MTQEGFYLHPMLCLTVFRGAGKSHGRSTWSSKAELQDYISFVGFFMYYLSNLYPPVPNSNAFDHYYMLAPILSGVPSARPPANLLLAGYSYGALLTRYLPNVPAMLGRFSKVLRSSTEAEIRMRAARLATVTIIDVSAWQQHNQPGAPNVSAALSFNEDWKRHRQEDLDLLQAPFVRKEKRNSWPDEEYGHDPSDDDYISRVDVPNPMTHYLLISLLLEPAASFCTRFQKLGNLAVDILDNKFLYNRTLAIHGEKDRITSLKKVGYWSEEIEENSMGRFRLDYVEDVGHFWREELEWKSLTLAIEKWTHHWLEDRSGLILD
ncbi:MAG: hypothetical protein Q9219_004065 [cf. Caloplaca sp. 3 TL-2023]